MTTLNDWLTTAANRLPHDLSDDDLSYRERDSLRALDALRAVLSLHAPRTVVPDVGPGDVCVECRQAFPCATVKSIEAAVVVTR